MAQLRDSTIDGNLEITGDIILATNSKSIKGVHPDTGGITDILHLSNNGNTVVGYGGYKNKSGNTHIYGEDVAHYVASADANFRPYYRAGDTIKFSISTSGYVTSSGTYVVFTVPVTKPIIGSPTATATSGNGFMLRQNGSYTHGSSASVYTKPVSYSVNSNYNSGFVVTAVFDVTTNVTNNDAIGVFWDGTITLS